MRPAIFHIPAATPFLPTLARALIGGELSRDGRPPDALTLADTTIYLPTRRATAALASAMVAATGSGATIMPRIRPLGMVEEIDGIEAAAGLPGDEALDPPVNLDACGALRPVDPIVRRLALARLISGWARGLAGEYRELLREPVRVPASMADAISFAVDLERLMDQVETQHGDWRGLADLVPAELSRYWQITAEFLRIATENWPGFLRDNGAVTVAAARRHALLTEAARLERESPHAPIIVAGSTGSVPATARLIAAVSQLPNGAVVLPGLDTDLDDETWATLAGGDRRVLGHPQFGLARLLGEIGAARADVRRLGPAPAAPDVARARLVSAAMRPASATDRWRADREAIGAEPFAAALEALALVEAADEREEALAIAVGMRQALAEGRTAALVTPARETARRVASELGRWSIEVDDSAGLPLAGTPVGILARLVAAVAAGERAAQLLALVKHPMCRLGMTEAARHRAVGALEGEVLRGPRLRPGLAAVAAALAAKPTDANADRREAQARRIAAARLVDRLAAALEPLISLGPGAVPVPELAAAHQIALAAVRREPGEVTQPRPADATGGSGEAAGPASAASALGNAGDASSGVGTAADDLPRTAADDLPRMAADAPPPVAGEAHGGVRPAVGDSRPDPADLALDRVFEALAAATPVGLDAPLSDWPAMFEALIDDVVVRRPQPAGHAVHIWGPLEARLQSVDRLFVAGLNEAVWPGRAKTGPFLSRGMMETLGLELPERRIGLAAHDISVALCGRDVVLTRARREGGTPTVESRWLLRLAALIGEDDRKVLVRRGDRLIGLARALDATDKHQPIRRPEPKPPLEARPRSLSVTEIGTLIRDPYAVYARRVLRLRPLDPLEADPDAADRGSLVHAILAEFLRGRAGPPDPADRDRFIAVAEAQLAKLADAPQVAALWRPRLRAISGAFIEAERQNAAAVDHRFVELKGSIEVPTSLGPVILNGRADRIDIGADGVTIVDYKTGTAPTAKQVGKNFEPQLPLEGMMIGRGGFAEVAADHPIAAMSYVEVRTHYDPVRWVSVATNGPAASLIVDAETKLANLLEAYCDPARGYVSRARVAFEKDFGGDYDHLARTLEWADAGGDDE